MNDVFISICIPAYKRTEYLNRLLHSIALQTYQDFEVIVTDDSNDASVKTLCEKYIKHFPLKYFKNEENLNTPENWNEAIRQARGKWIKLIHDDDWFCQNESLQSFVNAIRNNPGYSFYFSAYNNIYENTKFKKRMMLKPFWKKALFENPNILIARNVIGPPSVVLHRKELNISYDNRMKYVVDIDYYIRYLEHSKPFYINSSLLNIGINNAQVTKYTHGIADVHLFESLLLLEKTGARQLKNVLVFDGWWRLIRNFKIRGEDDLRKIRYKGVIPNILKSMIVFQKEIPDYILKVGLLSKFFMGLCYLKNKKTIKND